MKVNTLLLGTLLLMFFTVPTLHAKETQYSVTLSTDKPAYASSEKAILTIKNTGNNTVPYGYEYHLSRKLFSFWIPPIGVPLENTWLTILIYLPPGEENTQTINLSNFSSGTYGVAKQIGTQWFYTEFVVEGIDQLPMLSSIFALSVILVIALVVWRLKPKSGLNSYLRRE